VISDVIQSKDPLPVAINKKLNSISGKIMTRSKAINKNWYVAEKSSNLQKIKAHKKASKKITEQIHHEEEVKEPQKKRKPALVP